MRFVRDKSLKSFQDKRRVRTIRGRGDGIERILADINPMLRGWFVYFKRARPRLFRRLDGLIRRRLRAIPRKQEKRPGRGWCVADRARWANAFFLRQELFTPQTVHADARRSR